MTKENQQSMGVEAIKTLLKFDNSYTLRNVNVSKDKFTLEINLGSLKFTIDGDVASMLQIGLTVPRTTEPEVAGITHVAGKVSGFLKDIRTKAATKLATSTNIGKNYIKAAAKVLTSKEVQDDLLRRMQKELGK